MRLHNVSASKVCPICNKGNEFKKKQKTPLYDSDESCSSSSDESQPEIDTFDSEMKWWVGVMNDIKEERRKIMARYLSVIAKFQSDVFVHDMLDVQNDEDDIVGIENNLSHMRRELLNYQKKKYDSGDEDTLLITKAIEKEILVLEKKISRHKRSNGRKCDFKKDMDNSITNINALFESNAKKKIEHMDLKPVISHRCMKEFVDKVLGKKTTEESEKHWTCRKCSQEPCMWKCATCRTEVRTPIPYVESDNDEQIEQDSLLARELEYEDEQNSMSESEMQPIEADIYERQQREEETALLEENARLAEEESRINKLEQQYLQEETQIERSTRLLRQSEESEAAKWAVQELAIKNHVESLFSGYQRQEEKSLEENSMSLAYSEYNNDSSDEIDDFTNQDETIQDSNDEIDEISVNDTVDEDSDAEDSEDAKSQCSYKESKKRFFSERFIEHESEDERHNNLKKYGKMKRRTMFDDIDDEKSDESGKGVKEYGNITRRTIDNNEEDDSDSDHDDANLINDIDSVNSDDFSSDDQVHESDAIEDEDDESDDEENRDDDDDAVFHSDSDGEDYYSSFLETEDEVNCTQDEVYERFGNWIREHGNLFRSKFNENRLARRRSFDASGLSMMEYVAKTNLQMSYRKPPQRQYKSVRRYRDDTLRRKYHSPPRRRQRDERHQSPSQRQYKSPRRYRDDTLRRKYHSPPRRRQGDERHHSPPRRRQRDERHQSPPRRQFRPYQE